MCQREASVYYWHATSNQSPEHPPSLQTQAPTEKSIPPGAKPGSQHGSAASLAMPRPDGALALHSSLRDHLQPFCLGGNPERRKEVKKAAQPKMWGWSSGQYHSDKSQPVYQQNLLLTHWKRGKFLKHVNPTNLWWCTRARGTTRRGMSEYSLEVTLLVHVHFGKH